MQTNVFTRLVGQANPVGATLAFIAFVFVGPVNPVLAGEPVPVEFADGFENPGPPVCEGLPPMLCEGTDEYCGELVPFEPVLGPGYDNYPVNDETEKDQYRSFLRRDLMLLIKYATARVDCAAEGWDSGHGEPLGLGDMSEADGSIPGTSVGAPGHPPGQHEDGLDIDTAYYQTDTPDNHLRSICNTTDFGTNQYHCVDPPHLLDVERTALFLGYLAGHPRLRQVVVDGQAGLVIEPAVDDLCTQGYLQPDECTRLESVLTYEVANTASEYFYFFYHHIHISLLPPP